MVLYQEYATAVSIFGEQMYENCMMNLTYMPYVGLIKQQSRDTGVFCQAGGIISRKVYKSFYCKTWHLLEYILRKNKNIKY